MSTYAIRKQTIGSQAKPPPGWPCSSVARQQLRLRFKRARVAAGAREMNEQDGERERERDRRPHRRQGSQVGLPRTAFPVRTLLLLEPRRRQENKHPRQSPERASKEAPGAEEGERADESTAARATIVGQEKQTQAAPSEVKPLREKDLDDEGTDEVPPGELLAGKERAEREAGIVECRRSALPDPCRCHATAF